MAPCPGGVVESWCGGGFRGAAGGMPVTVHTLLGPEKTSAAWRGLGFRVTRRSLPCRHTVHCVGSGVCGWGGGWLLVEMCIVDASMLFSAPRLYFYSFWLLLKLCRADGGCLGTRSR